jgi:CRP-like cAMP-binding protein
MTIEDDIGFLERVPALAVLGRDALRILAIGSENRYVHEGVSLFGEGEDADGAYVVQEGSFDLVSRENGATSPTVVGPGALIGELALVTETKRPVSAIAREPSSVVRITRQLFMKMLESDPDAALRMRDAVASRTQQVTAEFAKVRATLVGAPARK